MPGQDGTGPNGSYKNCMPINEGLYGWGLRKRRGRGRANIINAVK